MIDIEEVVTSKFPGFSNQPALIRKPTISLLRKLTNEAQVNDFLNSSRGTDGFDFIDEVFDYFNFTYTVSARDRANIPAQGRVVIVANQPIGSLDGLAVLKLVGEVRRDVKILANKLLQMMSGVDSLFFPVETDSDVDMETRVKQALENEQAVIIFPSEYVSRAGPTGVKDGRWRPSFLKFARNTQSPLLPIHVGAKNSLLFYGASLLYKPMGTALLAREMMNKRSHTIRFRIGEAIPPKSLVSQEIRDKTLVKRLRKHLYKVGKKRNPIFETEKTVAHPEDRRALQTELKNAELLGQTRDGNRIYLVDYVPDSAVMRELGRLREVAFRKVGEGTGSKRDLDVYDQHYRHLILWDSENLVIAGAYRIGEGKRILDKYGIEGLYTRSLYQFEPAFEEYLRNGIELGRSFVNPDYWGKASLDYLWQGLGAYLSKHPARYVFGPVSMSADYPKVLMDNLVYFYSRYYACAEQLALAIEPYNLDSEVKAQLDCEYGELDAERAFEYMQKAFQEMGYKLPVLFKQYMALYEPGGFHSIVFSVDPDFGDCLDGMCMGDITKLKASKRRRYIPTDC